VDMDAIRAQHPVTERYAYFDHAAVAPMCAAARDAMVRHAQESAEHGDVHYGQWDRRIEAARASAAHLIGAQAGEVAFLKNTTEGIAFVAEGLRWQPGDNVVIPEREYPANVYPWMNLAERGVEVRWLPHRDGRVHIDALPEVCDARTRLVSLSFVQFASGFRTPLAEVGRFCRARNCLFFVDAIQGLGAFPLDVEADGIDFLAADGHKWLLGPEGAAIFYCRASRRNDLRLIEVGAGTVINRREYLTYNLTPALDARRFEAGSGNLPGVFALGAAVEYLMSVGIDAIAARVLALTDRLCAGLAQLGWTVLSSRRPAEASGIVMFSHPQHAPEATWRALHREHIILSLRAGVLRASPHFYNTEGEIDRLLAALPA
jgi:cysteine desulfurase/selenocysteine lyase